ncbi:peptidylprolyl isomerase [bacterium]|nr:peptidylprolyl isomerase [bacterium]
MKKNHRNLILSLLLMIVLLAPVSCAGKTPDETPTPTLEPTPTEAPMAAHVNGEGILLAEYEAEMQRYQAALQATGETFDPAAASQEVMDELIDQTLLAQAAAAQNYSVDEAALQARIDELAGEIGGSEALQTWMAQNFYNEESFRLALRRDMAATWMRNQLIAAVPTAVEQVHARQILLEDQSEAENVLRQLQAGTAFDTLAYEYDALTGGELGWFPHGYLLQPDVENTAFSLEAGGYSGIISTSYGYHIVQVIEKDAQHALSPDALLFTQRQALESWLEQQRSQSTIELSIP